MTNELKHYGILGMKWGVRKNKSNKSNRSVKNNRTNFFRNRFSKLKRKKLDVSKLSNEELIKRTTRLNLENNYKDALSRRRSNYGKRLLKKVTNRIEDRLIDTAVNTSFDMIKKYM